MQLRLLPLLLALLLPLAAIAQPLAGIRFAHETSDLKADPAVKFGQLPNGLRYAILQNAEPKGRASLRLLVAAGALHENESQRGLAHFLEHMAFNGSTHYAPGTLVEFFQRMGMSFGGDTNAYTSFDHTAYMLELADTKPETLAEGLRVFSDYAGGMLLLDAEIDKERGVILNEKRARDSVEFRQFVAEFDFLLAGTRLPARMPIGLPEIITSAPRPEFSDFYNTWYRPERLAVIAVGDFDPAALEKQITETFSPLAARAPARPTPDLGQLTPATTLRAHYHHEPEAANTKVGLQLVTTIPAKPDTAAQRLADLPYSLATTIINRRLAILAKTENAPFTSGSFGINDGFEFFREASLELTCKPDQWVPALKTAENELRRALTHGFLASELKEAVANFRNDLEQSLKTAPTRRSPTLASGLISALISGQVFTSPADDLALYGPALDRITPEQCHAALREAFANPNLAITVTGNAKLPSPESSESRTSPTSSDSSSLLLATYEKARAVPVTAPAEEKELTFAYTDFGAPATVTKREHIADLDVTTATLSNGVRINLKKTDFEKGKIQATVRLGTGELGEPQNLPGLASYASNTLVKGGLGRHSADDLEKILAGKNVGIRFNTGRDAFAFSTTTTPEDLLLQFQMFTALLTDPGYRPEAHRQFQKYAEQFYTKLEHSPTGPLQTEIPALLANNSPRFHFPSKAEATARTSAELRAWLTPAFAHDYLEVTLVGDLDPDATLDALCRTLGTLAPRQPKPPMTEARQVSFPSENLDRTFTTKTSVPKGAVALFWPATDASDHALARRIELLADIFGDRLRLKIREELGESYSPQAAAALSETYPNYGLLYTVLIVDPAKAADVQRVTLALAADLATGNITADELNRLRLPALTAIKEADRTNKYWLSALNDIQEKPATLERIRARHADLESITLEELNALAKKYFPAARAHRFQILPEKKEPPAAAAPAS